MDGRSDRHIAKKKAKMESKSLRLKACFRCKSWTDVDFVEVHPDKPNSNSKWSLCGKCRRLFYEQNIKGFPAARKFAIDFRKRTCK